MPRSFDIMADPAPPSEPTGASRDGCPSRDDDWPVYQAAVDRLDALIASEPSADPSPAAIRARAEQRLERVRHFLRFLGDPQSGYPIVHVGGTSGKGSTSAAIASVLSAGGYRVGLHTSPYLQVATEKLQRDGQLIGATAFAELVDSVLDAADRFTRRRSETGLTYGEVWTALATRWFATEVVDVAVIEVGAGGRFDQTNVISPAVSVITTVGLDHTATLGNTIPEIAWHKAGIIKAGAPVVTSVSAPDALAPILAEATHTGSIPQRVIPGTTFEVLSVGPDGTRWRQIDGGVGGPVFTTPLPGEFQATNAALAVAAVRALAPRGLPVADEAVLAGLAAARLPGRFEWMPIPGGPAVVLDGAHNPEKMVALARDLPRTLPPSRGKLVVLFGALEGKRAEEMLGMMMAFADALVVTAPWVLAKTSVSPERIAAIARRIGGDRPIEVAAEPAAALDAARRLAGDDGTILVTGSLYLVGNLRGAWYPDRDVVHQRTPWPAGLAAPAGAVRVD
jgi:dihydrofolate synthase/folylpolyglutamate synthase